MVEGAPSTLGENGAGGLMSWRHQGAVAAEMCERLLRDLRFDAAARRLARGMLDAAAADSRVDGVFKDAGRYVAAMIAMLLHDSGGLTLPRLKDFCERSGFVSRSRARGMLLYLRFLGYVEPGPREKGAPQRFVPTASFEAAWAVQCAAALEAAVVIEPTAGRVARALGQPGVLAHFARVHAEHLFQSAASTDETFAPELLHRHAGSHLIWLLVVDEAESFPPVAARPISVAGFARRFGVSRPHVRRLLQAGVEAGILRRVADGAIAFSEAHAPRLRLFYAQQLVAVLSSAALTLQALGL